MTAARLTPGAYLQRRRIAAGVTIEEVAALLVTDPHHSQIERARTVELIEADVQPATFATIVALHSAYRFDLAVLYVLEAIAQGEDRTPPRMCRVCACTDRNRCRTSTGGCHWIADDLCSNCAPMTGEPAVAA